MCRSNKGRENSSQSALNFLALVVSDALKECLLCVGCKKVFAVWKVTATVCVDVDVNA